MAHIYLRKLGAACSLAFAVIVLSSCVARQTVQGTGKQYVITAGSGVIGCTVGDDEMTFQNEFGGSKEDSYWIAKVKGVDANTKNGNITVMFFYFYSRSHQTFNGRTVDGIGADSTVDDVLRHYGRPEKISESTVSQFGAMPGAREKHLDYDSSGISFVFWDGRLADIRVYKPR